MPVLPLTPLGSRYKTGTICLWTNGSSSTRCRPVVLWRPFVQTSEHKCKRFRGQYLAGPGSKLSRNELNGFKPGLKEMKTPSTKESFYYSRENMLAVYCLNFRSFRTNRYFSSSSQWTPIRVAFHEFLNDKSKSALIRSQCNQC
jgi:hypothetical protein